jgi:hypothetical protein
MGLSPNLGMGSTGKISLDLDEMQAENVLIVSSKCYWDLIGRKIIDYRTKRSPTRSSNSLRWPKNPRSGPKEHTQALPPRVSKSVQVFAELECFLNIPEVKTNRQKGE